MFVSQRLRILTAGAADPQGHAPDGQAVATAQDPRPWVLMVVLAFVHHSAIEADGYRSLQDNQRVEYNVTQGAKGPQAEQVRPI